MNRNLYLVGVIKTFHRKTIPSDNKKMASTDENRIRK